jgi:hypothetical protein
LVAVPWLLTIAEMSFIVYAVGKLIAFPGGSEALWGLAGLVCLLLAAIFVLALRTRSRRTLGAGEPKGAARDAVD